MREGGSGDESRHGHAGAAAHAGGAHVVPLRTYYGVYGALLVLTALTVGASLAGLGSSAIFIALTIATIKASLVAGYFMHLRWDDRFLIVVLLSSVVFLSFFLGLTLLDVRARGMVAEEEANFLLERDREAAKKEREGGRRPPGAPAVPEVPSPGGRH